MRGKLQTGPQAKLRKLVVAVGTVGVEAPQHNALAVIALLHAGVKVAVAVEAEEKLLQPFQRGVPGQAARIDIGAVVGVHVLVEPPDRVVIVAAQPHHIVQDAEHLQRLGKGARRIHRHTGQHIRHIPALPSRTACSR